MPTENRSSNTEQMVSVPRSLLEEACNGLRITQDRARKELRALLAQPANQPAEVTGDDVLRWMDEHAAAQHQGEPVAWVIFDNGFIDDHTTDKDLADGWREQGLEVSALYTHPDAGKLVQLREGIARQWRVICDQRAELDTLRAQMAERDALLRDINKRHSSGVDFDLPADLAARVAAVCATSAEPSAPDNPNILDAIAVLFGGKAEARAPKSCGACANGCISGCQLEKDSPPSECQHRYMHFGDQDKRRCADCSKVEPSAPVERDDLTSMVDAAMVEMAGIHPPLKRSECERLIRAALERKP
ncbi:hypothetical protein [Pseudomonas sp. AE27]|uniref:hypothetical protein n=1 Tax=Pseudomonas sp. AE27 TaxID=3127460 RepID=UPI0030CD0622